MAVSFNVAQGFCLARKAADFDDASTSAGDDLSVLDEVCSQASFRQASLVWCHERCHKRESQEVRNALGRTGPLVCLKKAAKLAGWCTRSEGQPYVLLTDWREVKPCMTHLEALPACRRPMLTVVLCDGPEATVYPRASAWARGLGPEAGNVRVVKELQSALHLVQAACSDSPSASRQSSKSPCASRQPSKCAQPEQAPAVLPCHGAAMAAITGAWVQEALSPFGMLGPQELQALLLAAAPASYED